MGDSEVEKARRYWNALAVPPAMFGVYGMGGGGYTEVQYRHFFELRHLRRLVDFNRTMRVLELGCGTGRWALSLAPAVSRYYAVDFAPAALAHAQAEAERQGLRNLEFIAASILEAELPERLDVAYFSGVLQYIGDQDAVALLTRLRPKLLPGAVVIDRSTIQTQAREVRDDGEYFAIYRTVAELEGLFAGAGFALGYAQPSYRYLRFSRLLRNEARNRRVAKVAVATRPLSFLLMHAFSWLADQAWPRVVEGGKYAHMLFIFRRRGA